MYKGRTVCIVTRVMDRLEHLKKSLPTWVSIPDYDSIIIVDWGSKNEDILPFVQSLKEPRIIVIKVKGQDFFDRGAAHNTGIRFSQTELIHIIDCDVLLRQNVLSVINENKEKEFYIYGLSIQNHGTTGTCIIRKKQWEIVHGYAENLLGWGYEDVDFYNKLTVAGFEKKEVLKYEMTEHIEHDDTSRFIHHKVTKNCNFVNNRLLHMKNNDDRLSEMNIITNYQDCTIHYFDRIEERKV
jgi:predicted glycosyltransferase involved in capsule biosynthesis